MFEDAEKMNDYIYRLKGDICCWHCTLPAKEIIAFAKPINDALKVKAYVCSFPCMIAYVNTFSKTRAKQNKNMHYV